MGPREEKALMAKLDLLEAAAVDGVLALGAKRPALKAPWTREWFERQVARLDDAIDRAAAEDEHEHK